MKVHLYLMNLVGFLWSLGAIAGSDPVSWSLNPKNGFLSTKVGQQSIVQYTLTNRFPYPAILTTFITITGAGFNIHDACKNTSLAPGGSCRISVRFKPSSAGVSTFKLEYGYHNKRILLPALTAVGADAVLKKS